MFRKLYRYFSLDRSLNFVSGALARGAATSSLRRLEPHDPASWEFTAFSQNGEDGIIDYLTRRIREPIRYFLEVGASSGIENNGSWLAIARRFSGIFVEGDTKSFRKLSVLYRSGIGTGVVCRKMIVTPENVRDLVSICPSKNIDVLSVDIDGNDYYIVRALLEAGLRPSIVIVEYNSAFGPEQSLTIPYSSTVPFLRPDDVRLYYGVSITGWRRYFEAVGYRFLCVETNGVNAFFVNPAAFDPTFLMEVQGLEFRENNQQLGKCGGPWQTQFALIKDRPLATIP